MRNYIILLYISILCSSCGMSQSKDSIDNISRKKTFYITENLNFKENLRDKPYLLFSINDKWYYIVVKEKNNLKEYFFTLNSENKIEPYHKGIIKNPKDFLTNSFNADSFHRGFINLNSKFYESGYEISNGNPTYFYFKNKKGEIYGESKLTTIINPNPIDSQLYNYLLGKALSIVDKK